MLGSRVLRVRRFGRIILRRLRTAFRSIRSERFARTIIVAVDFALAVYQTAIVAT